VNVALVIDTSGSMEGKPLEDARSAARALVRSLADGDRLAVVAFGTRAEVLQASSELDGDVRAEIEKKLAAMRASGTTDLAAGLNEGLEQVNRTLVADGINRIVLLGDGIPNDASSVAGQVETARSRGITITTLGLGIDYDEALMGQIAQRSGGKFRHIDDSAKVADFFRDEVLRIQGVVAMNLGLKLTPGPGVKVVDVVGQRWQPNGSGASIELGDLSRGEERTVYVEVAATTRRSGTPVELLDAEISWSAPGSGQRETLSSFVASRSAADEAAVRTGRAPAVELGAALARSAAATVRALELARAGQHHAARSLLESTAKKLDEIAVRLKNPKLVEEAKALRALTTDLPPASAPPARQAQEPAEEATPEDLERPAPAAAAAPRSPEQARRAMKQYDSAMQRLQ
jgi:Ca-activated chloride channel homolog